MSGTVPIPARGQGPGAPRVGAAPAGTPALRVKLPWKIPQVSTGSAELCCCFELELSPSLGGMLGCRDVGCWDIRIIGMSGLLGCQDVGMSGLLGCQDVGIVEMSGCSRLDAGTSAGVSWARCVVKDSWLPEGLGPQGHHNVLLTQSPARHQAGDSREGQQRGPDCPPWVWEMWEQNPGCSGPPPHPRAAGFGRG